MNEFISFIYEIHHPFIQILLNNFSLTILSTGGDTEIGKPTSIISGSDLVDRLVTESNRIEFIIW